MSTFRILNGVLACLVAVSFPGKVTGEVVEGGKNISSQTSNLTLTNDYPDLRLSKEFFKRFLENPYPVRKVVFFQPRDADNPMTVLLCEGSLQPDTFYIRQLEEPRLLEHGKYRNLSDGRAVGKSSSGKYWSVDGKAARGHGGEITITESNVIDTLAYTDAKLKALELLPTMRDACWFGFNFMVPNTASWHGDRFTVQFLDSQAYPHETNVYTANGEVLAYTNNLPLLVRVESEHWPKALRWLEFTYEYDFSQSNRFYPVKMTSTGIFNGKRYPMSTETLDVEFGIADLAANGYTASNFVPNGVLTQADVYITSTTGEYWVNGRQFVGVGKTSPPRRALIHMTSSIRLLIIILMVLPAAFLIRWQRKTKTKQ